MTAEDFCNWLEKRRWRFTDAAAVLGIHRDTASAYAAGTRHIPKPVALAISAVEADLPPWPERKEPRA